MSVTVYFTFGERGDVPPNHPNRLSMREHPVAKMALAVSALLQIPSVRKVDVTRKTISVAIEVADRSVGIMKATEESLRQEIERAFAAASARTANHKRRK